MGGSAPALQWARYLSKVPRDYGRVWYQAARGLVDRSFDRGPDPLPDSPDAVFLWLPKTAGFSLFWMLAPQGCRLHNRPHRVRNSFTNEGFVSFGHYSYAALLDRGVVQADFDARALKFCVVRNPYDRAVSLYSYLRGLGRIPPNEDFDGFARRLRQGRHHPVGRYNVRGLNLCSPQTAWLHRSDGSFIPDLVGRFEDLGTFRLELGERLDIEFDELPNVNSSKRATDYRSYYDSSSRADVAAAYADDLAAFDYEF